MANQVNGTIEGWTHQTINTKSGRQATIYGARIAGEDYEFGFKKPEGIEVGDNVSAGWEIAYGKRKILSIQKAPALVASVGNSTPLPAPAQNPGKQLPYRPFPIPPDHGDRSIIRQNSVTNAREFVCSFYGKELEADAVVRLFELADLFETYSSGGQTALEIAATLKMCNGDTCNGDKPEYEPEPITVPTAVVPRPRGRPRSGAVANG